MIQVAPTQTNPIGLSRHDFIKEFNSHFASGETFFFLIDYELTYFDVVGISNRFKNESDSRGDIFFSTPGWSFPQSVPSLHQKVIFEKFPIPYSEYALQFKKVMNEIRNGNTYLLNLTTETPIYTDLTLKQIYTLSRTPYRLNYRNHFLSFSPETFVKITDGVISAFPMKGTYTTKKQANKASQKMNLKELSEQTTVVDRVRNDFSRICDRVRVESFLTIEEVETHQGKLYQTISQVVGELGINFFRDPAEAFLELLPAASVTGAPRNSTVSIIREVESHRRNFYTGVWGIGHKGCLESAVIIRYIEQRGRKLFYKSGGGITSMSEAKKEYQEMVDKVYLPFRYC